MQHRTDDTICAIATAKGEGGIGIIRVSGPKAVSVASRVVKLRSGRAIEEVRSRTLYTADVAEDAHRRQPRSRPERGSALDEALVVLMRGPRSYTGEDVIEIHCHGGPLVLHCICEAILHAGARLAEPGEFTKRAFLNGRMDLIQVEAVLDTIQATTTASLKLAQQQLRGTLSQEINGLRQALIRVLAHVEAGMDFSEEDITFIEPDELEITIENALGQVKNLLESSKEGRVLREGVRVAIMGRPNVGKSSILNALLRIDRAIVSPIPGTTRDVLDEVVNIQGIPVRLNDTAGLRETDDQLEGEGVRRTRDAIEQADLLLIVVDSSVPLSAEDRDLVEANRKKKCLIVLNKMDLPCLVSQSELASLLMDSTNKAREQLEFGSVWISAVTGEGMDSLRDSIYKSVLRSDLEPRDSVLVTRLRHQTGLFRVKDSLEHGQTAVRSKFPGEFVALELRAAVDSLGEITGDISTEDVLDKIFKEFCIGK